jgi:hypothetical protein
MQLMAVDWLNMLIKLNKAIVNHLTNKHNQLYS